ncbi:DUF1566 domain-containing protein [Desulfobulbus sp. F5]|nr:DUF1566 domain-containing protein [Desulfobulbus sp. F5]
MRTFFLLICCMFSAVTVHADCKPDAIPPSTPDIQLQDNSDGTVTATVTATVTTGAEASVSSNGATVSVAKLMWKKCLEGVTGEKCECENCPKCKNCSPSLFTWQEALQQPRIANQAAGAVYKDWRLPTLTELRSLVEVQCNNPAINPNRFPNTPSSAVWSISPYADAPDSAWFVHFYYGLPFFDYRSSRFAVRLVRNVTQ